MNTDIINDLYKKVCEIDSDIRHHCPILYDLAKEIDHVTEFSHYGGTKSTTSFLATNIKKVISYQPNLKDENLLQLQKLEPERLFVIEEFSENILEIEQTDLLFIDSPQHTRRQIELELLHADRVNKWIVMHDTTTFGETANDGTEGLLFGIRDFLAKHPEWHIKRRYTEYHGLTILERSYFSESIKVDRAELMKKYRDDEIQSVYRESIRISSNINEHCETLFKLGTEVDIVTEFGVCHAVSTSAFLAANPKKMHCYDIEIKPEAKRLQKLSNGIINLYEQDVLKTEIVETDLLFIDSLHTYNQLKMELKFHAEKVKKYIVLHDTTTFGIHGEHGQEGLWRAIEEFLVQNSNWRIKRKYENNNGLTILEKFENEKINFVRNDLKILHISHFDHCDYMNDMIFHGGKSTFGVNYFESKPAPYMYQNYNNKEELYGLGFSLYCRLPNNLENVCYDIKEKIQQKYFDIVIYGSATRCLDHLDLVKTFYSKNEIVFIDGEDKNSINSNFLIDGFLFKRELVDDDPKINSINFSIPKELFIYSENKSNFLSIIKPLSNDSYKIKNEIQYHQEYQNSFFGITQRKGGWDCMRHQEIIANYCFPWFIDLEKCPSRTMTLFPKKQILNYMFKYGKNVSPEWFDIMKDIHNHGKKYLTTEYTINYILEKINYKKNDFALLI